MAVSRHTKYMVLNFAFVGLLLLVFRYYVSVMKQPRDGSQIKTLTLYGIALYIIAAGVIVARAYLKGRNSLIDQSPRESELNAFGKLGALKMKPITTTLQVSRERYKTLSLTGQLIVGTNEFELPIRNRDTVMVSLNKSGDHRMLPTKITKIDGVNMQVTLTKQERPLR